MSRATYVFAGTTVLGVVTSAWLYLDNRALRDEVQQRDPAAVAAAGAAKASEPPRDVWLDATTPRDGKLELAAKAPPKLPEAPQESRLDRRVRRTEELAAMFGRAEGETDEEYRARVMPLIEMGLSRPRTRSAENRKLAEAKAGVTPEQSAKIDQAMEKVYADVLDYTNKAVADGQLSPYERNVAGWLDYAGGLGGILNEAQGSIGKILTPQQMKAMYDTGFEWGEYLGAHAPWERINPPPPRK